jgi:hypothetical protein
MASVMFISERGFPHAAVNINNKDWYGFKPRVPKMALSPGVIDRSNLTANVKHSVTFTIDDAKVVSATQPILLRYQSSWYKGGVRDCVTFVADLAEAMGLQIPKRPNFLPDHFVIGLAVLNHNTAT